VARGFEPDSCFYFGEQAALIRGRERIDLHVDPAPALVVEVDLTHPSLDKLPIYAALGVAEVWRLDGENVWFYQRRGATYVAVDTSTILADVTPSEIAAFIARGRETDRQVLFDEVRASAQP
jgi:Uma2 family endonuclease